MSPTSSPLLRQIDTSLKSSELSRSRLIARKLLPIVVILFLVFHFRFVFPQLVSDAQSFLPLSSPASSLRTSSNGPELTGPDYISTTDDAIDIPESRHFIGVAGFNLFENLYYHNGTFFFVTSHPEQVPSDAASRFLSSPREDGATGDAMVAARTDRWDVLSVNEARERLAPLIVRKKGLTFFFNDESTPENPSFLGNYFHYVGEMFFGGVMVASAAGHRDPPTRVLFRSEPGSWRDEAGINAWFHQSILPSTSIEEGTIFRDRTDESFTFLFDEITIMDRNAAHRSGGANVRGWNKANADLLNLPVSRDWIKPLRDSVRHMAAAAGCTIGRHDARVPVVLYDNRQKTNRRLNSDDADDLSFALKRLANQAFIELHDVQLDTLPPLEQFCLATRADVMLGVHSTGLAHQMWMKPGSAVIEMMSEIGFIRDYGLMADLLGHEYHAVHNDHAFVRANWDEAVMNDGFSGSEIRASSRFVSLLVLEMAQMRTKSVEAALGIENGGI